MFGAWLEESLGDPSALLHLASDAMIGERITGCRKLLVAAAWADCHGAPDDRAPVCQSALVDRYVQLGGRGTPLVSQDCAGELGHAQQIGVVAATRLIADALTIRHRLPLLWQRVKTGQVWAWKASKIAQASRHLAVDSSLALDRQTTPDLELMAWGRFLDLLDATLLNVDQTAYQRRAAEAAAQRDVRSYRGQHGLRTLIAKAEAGDVLAFEALVARVADCLADEGDEDPVAVRRSTAIGIIAHPARLHDLLVRHADQPDDPRHPEQRVNAHQEDPSDPWAAEDLPPAGWETHRHGNYHQPGLDDLDDLHDSWTSRTDNADPGWDEDSSVDDDAQTRYDQQFDDNDDVAATPQPAAPPTPVPAAFDRSPRDHRGACTSCGSSFDLQPLSKTALNACRTKAVIHVHVSDQTLIDRHGVLRTADGPITLDQFRRWLTDTDATITIRPVLDPASVAAVDNYEIPVAMREAVHTRHPGSIWPFSPATAITTGGRLDLDHTIAYRTNGPPGQTAVDKLGPLARPEHQPKTHGSWQTRQPDLGKYVWRSPHGWISIVTNQGTLLLGDSPWAHAIWKASQPDSQEIAS